MPANDPHARMRRKAMGGLDRPPGVGATSLRRRRPSRDEAVQKLSIPFRAPAAWRSGTLAPSSLARARAMVIVKPPPYDLRPMREPLRRWTPRYAWPRHQDVFRREMP